MPIRNVYEREDGISVHLHHRSEEQAAEDAFFRNSDAESCSAPLYKSLLIKAQSLLLFEDIVSRYGISFNGRMLELGGGYGYLSAYIKARFPEVTVVYSDISEEAVRKSSQYESFFGITLDGKWVTSAEDTPFEDGSFDTVLFFASFHHTQDAQAAVRESARVLRTGGQLVLLMEPSCPAHLRPLYERHIRRSGVQEKVYSLAQYRAFFDAAGLSFRHWNYRNYIYRWRRSSAIYYLLLSALPHFLAHAFPCTQVIVGEKRGR